AFSQQREVSRVIEVRVTQHHGGERRDVGNSLGPVLDSERFLSLEQAAIEQHAGIVGGHEVHGSGDGPRTTEKLERYRRLGSGCDSRATVGVANGGGETRGKPR